MARKRRPPRPGALADLAPLPILRKIVLLQATYYLSAVVLIVFSMLVAGKQIRMDLIWGWHTLRSDTTIGWMLALVWLFNSLISVVSITIMVMRSKLVPDFALTIHLVHFVLCSAYSRAIPSSVFWWGVQFASAAIMVSLGVWSCRHRELKPLPYFLGATRQLVEDGSALIEGDAGTGDSHHTFELERV